MNCSAITAAELSPETSDASPEQLEAFAGVSIAKEASRSVPVFNEPKNKLQNANDAPLDIEAFSNQSSKKSTVIERRYNAVSALCERRCGNNS